MTRPGAAAMETSALQGEGTAGVDHWRLLDNLKTTVEGLVSGNSRNVWSKYGGLQRLCRDMSSILQHGLICDQVYCNQQDYWNFVKSSQRFQPDISPQVEQFLNFLENSQRNCDSTSEGNSGNLWLQHSLQFHCLSTQLKALLGNGQYIRKFYSDCAFLLSKAHVTAMFQCLEAVEQNNPRLLAQIDTSMLAGKREFLLSGKSLSLTALPGSTRASYTDNPKNSLYGSYSNLQLSTTDQQENLYKAQITPNEMEALSLGTSLSSDMGPQEPFSPISEMSISTLTNQSEEACSQEDPHSEAVCSQEDLHSEADEGPEYLAIGNMCRRTSSQSSGSSNLFPSGSSHKSDALCSNSLAPPNSSLSTSTRRSSFTEGQTGQSLIKKSHMRSHSDTNVCMGKMQGGGRNITIIMEEPVADSHTDFSMRNNTAFNVKDNIASTPYMEYDNAQCFSTTEGIFRRPSKGQSLISYLSEQDFGSCADLEKENAHFSISESLIAAIELMKCNMMNRHLQEEEEDSDHEIRELKQKIRLRRQQIRTHQTVSSNRDGKSSSTGITDNESQMSSRDSTKLSDSDSVDEVDQYEIKDADIKKTTCSRPVQSADSIRSYSYLHSNSAEAVAMGLLKQFEGMQLPAASELEWLVPEQDAPQKLLPIPDSVPISPDDGEHADIYKLRIRVRGNLEWAPPRPQIIFNIHPAPTRKVSVTKQNYRCAGCGIRTEPDYIKRLRYCEYLGKYFCQCCHENAQSVIPGRILRKWDFSKYYVSNFSKDLLTKIWSDPLFNLNDINSALYRKIKALEQVRLLRIQLVHLKNMFKTCRLAQGTLESFDTVPGHLTEDLHLFSLSDLTVIKKGELAPLLKELVKIGTLHVDQCMLCQAKGFICEFCQNGDDVIFPFELNKCRRCEDCKACYHKTCFRSDQCPKCERLRARRDLLDRQTLELYNSDHEEETLQEKGQ